MSLVAPPECAVSCRVCGATHAAPSFNENLRGFCGACATDFGRMFDYKPPTDEAVDAFLAASLARQTARIAKRGFSTRCQFKLQSGFQCQHWATVERDGCFLCAGHAQREEYIFFPRPHQERMAEMTDLMAEVASINPAFRDCLLSAAQLATPKKG